MGMIDDLDDLSARYERSGQFGTNRSRSYDLSDEIDEAVDFIEKGKYKKAYRILKRLYDDGNSRIKKKWLDKLLDWAAED